MLHNQKVTRDEDFIFYNNLKHSSGAVEHLGDDIINDYDDELIKIDLNKMPDEINKVAFIISIYEARENNQSFNDLSNVYMRVISDSDDRELFNYELSHHDKNIANAISVVMAELRRISGDNWGLFKVAKGLPSDIVEICRFLGVNA